MSLVGKTVVLVKVVLQTNETAELDLMVDLKMKILKGHTDNNSVVF